jgi:hypothetical protein
LLLLPSSDQAKVNAALVAFSDLWFEGKIAGTKMETVLCDWIALLRSLRIDPGDGPAGVALAAAAPTEFQKDREALLKCDPEFAKFLNLLSKAVDNCGQTKEIAS